MTGTTAPGPAGGGVAGALQLFQSLYLDTVEYPELFPAGLAEAGYVETQRKRSVDAEGSRIARVLYHRPGADFAFAVLISDWGAVSDGAVILPAGADAERALTDWIGQQPNLTETTEEARHFFAFAPEDVSWSLVDTRFWTAKTPGQTGINIALGPALVDFPDGGKAIALTVSANPSLQDPLDAETLAELTGAGSRLAKFVLIFSEIATKACPDPERIKWAAESYGYAGDVEPGARSFQMHGGHGPHPRSEDRSSTIHVNRETRHDFEFAITFILDERLEAEVIRAAVFGALGISGALPHEDTAELTVQGETYRARHECHSAIFGNHAFLLQR